MARKCTPFRIRKPPTVAGAVVQHWISRYETTSSTSFRSGRKFRLCGIAEGVCELLSELTRPEDHTFAHSQMAWWRGLIVHPE
ncbi:hypothetical protein TNCV_4356041 [Trichonephila clavipes]|nr:hypothetical protein TNCV_4356041 [Trichonephila clavipes]